MSRPRPLLGRRVIVTRGTDKADRLPGLLVEAGATVVHVPLIVTERTADVATTRAAVERLRDGGPAASRWLVLTSEVAAGMVLDAAGPGGLDGVAVAAVGPATAAALRARGVAAGLVASGGVAESLAAELVAGGVAGARALVIAAAGGREVIAPALVGAGASVEVLEAYRSVIPTGAAEMLRAALAPPPPDAIIFTSGSTVRHCSESLSGAAPPGIPAICIGPVTAAAAGGAGWTEVVTAAVPTAAGIVAVAVARLATAQPLP